MPRVTTLKAAYLRLTLDEALRAPITALVGVTEQAQAVLVSLSIFTVFDLAMSRVFGNAKVLVEQEGAGSLFTIYRMVPSDILGPEYQRADLSWVIEQDISALDGIGPKNGPSIAAALGLSTIRDFAAWPPYLAARELLEGASARRERSSDEGIPDELVPRFNEYPIEREFFSIYTVEADDDVDGLIDLEDALDLGEALVWRSRVRQGHVVRFEQSWTPVGLALGNLLHSLALAPGESTRIAIIDWTRRQSVRTDETAAQLEELSNSLTQTRALSEVTRAVAREAQRGFSNTHSNSTVSNSGYATYGIKNPLEVMAAATAGAGAGIAGGLSAGITGGGLLGGLPLAAIAAPGAAVLGGTMGGLGAGLAMAQVEGTSRSTSNAETDAVSTLSSGGERNIYGEMIQNIADRTQQISNSLRNRRASIVQEVVQSENEKITTRVVTNYNHMHALTIQYFEVVQLYKVAVRAVDVVTPCLYVPIKPIRWTGALVERFRNALQRVALQQDIRLGLMVRTEAAVLTSPTFATLSTAGQAKLRTESQQAEREAPAAKVPAQAMQTPMKGSGQKAGEASGGAKEQRRGIEDDPQGTRPMQEPGDDPSKKAAKDKQERPPKGQGYQSGAGAGTGTGHGNKPPKKLRQSHNFVDLAGLLLSPDTLLFGVEADAEDDRIPGMTLSIVQTDGYQVPGDESTFPVRVGDISRIQAAIPVDSWKALRHSGGESPWTFVGVFGQESEERRIKILCNIEAAQPTPDRGAYRFDVLSVTRALAPDSVLRHLNENTAYYTPRVIQFIEDYHLAGLLSQYRYRGKRLTDLIDMRPIAISGDSLVFRLSQFDPTEVEGWKGRYKFPGVARGTERVDVIPLGTGGVFAEAVQGRANAAEKLDMTRFWNWQDSPPPIMPPDIAPVQSDSRATPTDARPAGLDHPIVGFYSPQPFPTPTGLQAALAAVAAPNIFRDMSGIAQTAQLAQATLEQAMSGATTTAGQASGSLAKGLELTKELSSKILQMSQDLAGRFISAGASAPQNLGNSSVSNAGAMLNQGKRLDEKTQKGGGGLPTDMGLLLASGGQAGPAFESAAFTNALGSGLLAFAPLPVTGTNFGSARARKAWPYLDPTAVLTRIDTLRKDATQFDQGDVGLCTAAAFYHHIIQRKSEEFESFAKALYYGGIGFLGKLKVTPDVDLRSTDYAALAAKYARIPPQADWMLMSSLRDSENWILDFEGGPDESVAISTSARELGDWYEKTGLYTGVNYTDEADPARLKAISKTANNHVCLWVYTDLINNGGGRTTHIITLESNILIDEVNNKASFDYWCWGQPIGTLSTTWTRLKANFLGVIIATF